MLLVFTATAVPFIMKDKKSHENYTWLCKDVKHSSLKIIKLQKGQPRSWLLAKANNEQLSGANRSMHITINSGRRHVSNWNYVQHGALNEWPRKHQGSQNNRKRKLSSRSSCVFTESLGCCRSTYSLWFSILHCHTTVPFEKYTPHSSR